MVNCPFCNSPRIISARHDSDWGGGNSIGTVNPDEVYAEGDLTEEGDVYSFGDIDILVCLGCDYTWQRYGNFRPTPRALDGLERVALHCTCPDDADHPDCPVHGTSRQ